ncbi:MAG: hypothetical protein LUH08_03925, partial [Ruminococcus sp.]|nr:hypothetical protein [Ruminococcus sp.]
MNMYEFNTANVIECAEGLERRCLELDELKVNLNNQKSMLLGNSGTTEAENILLSFDSALSGIGEQTDMLKHMIYVLKSIADIYSDGDKRSLGICSGEQKLSEAFLKNMLGTQQEAGNIAVPVHLN